MGTRGRSRDLPGISTIILLLALLLVLPPAGAAVRFDMFTGYDGVVPQGSWFPVAFEVQNDGPAFTATVEVTPGQYNNSQMRTMVVELPTGTTKRFIIPVATAVNWNPTWNARLLDEKGRTRAEASSQRLRRLNESQVPLAAAMTRAMPPLPELKSRQEDLRPVFGRLQPSVFPDNPIALEGLDSLYLGSEKALDLRVNQVGPLLAWLYGGGHLIVGLEQLNHLTGPGEWLRQLLPCEVTGVTTLAVHSELETWLESRARFNGSEYEFSSATSLPNPGAPSAGVFNPYSRLSRDARFEETPLQIATTKVRDGRALIGSTSSPLAIIAKRGRGQITVLTFAPELEPFRSWQNSPHFWAKMIDFPPALLSTENVNRYPGRPVDGVFGAMIDSKQVRKLPVGWLLLLLVGYLVVIGPLDQYWLKKLNKQMLTWLTFPAYVAFFSLLIYFIGYKLRAGETEWNELHVVDVTPHGETADVRGRTYGSIYSPVNARYIFSSELPFATMRGEFSGNYGNFQESTRAAVEQRPAGFRAVTTVPVWTSQLLVSDWWRQEPVPVDVVVTPTEVKIDNHLDTRLAGARLILNDPVLRDVVLDLGEIGPLEAKTVSRKDARANSLVPFVQSYGGNFQSAVNARQQAFGDNRVGKITDLPNATMAASFITLLNSQNNYENFSPPPGFDLTSLVKRGDAIFLAWVPKYSPTKPLNQFTARRGSKDTLLRVVVEPQR